MISQYTKYFATQLEAHGGFLAQRIIFEDVLVTKLFHLALDRINHARRKNLVAIRMMLEVRAFGEALHLHPFTKVKAHIQRMSGCAIGFYSLT